MKQTLHFSKDKEIIKMRMDRFNRTYKMIMESVKADDGKYKLLAKKFGDQIISNPELKEAVDDAVEKTWTDLSSNAAGSYILFTASGDSQVSVVDVTEIKDEEAKVKVYDFSTKKNAVKTCKKGEILSLEGYNAIARAENKKADDAKAEYQARGSKLKQRRGGVNPSEVEGYDEFKKQVIALRKAGKGEGSREFEDLFKSQPEEIQDAFIKDEESQPVHSYSDVYTDRQGAAAADDRLEQQKRRSHISYLESLCGN